jgi:hypothetical protein
MDVCLRFSVFVLSCVGRGLGAGLIPRPRNPNKCLKGSISKKKIRRLKRHKENEKEEVYYYCYYYYCHHYHCRRHHHHHRHRYYPQVGSAFRRRFRFQMKLLSPVKGSPDLAQPSETHFFP